MVCQVRPHSWWQALDARRKYSSCQRSAVPPRRCSTSSRHSRPRHRCSTRSSSSGHRSYSHQERLSRRDRSQSQSSYSHDCSSLPSHYRRGSRDRSSHRRSCSRSTSHRRCSFSRDYDSHERHSSYRRDHFRSHSQGGGDSSSYQRRTSPSVSHQLAEVLHCISSVERQQAYHHIHGQDQPSTTDTLSHLSAAETCHLVSQVLPGFLPPGQDDYTDGLGGSRQFSFSIGDLSTCLRFYLTLVSSRSLAHCRHFQVRLLSRSHMSHAASECCLWAQSRRRWLTLCHLWLIMWFLRRCQRQH